MGYIGRKDSFFQRFTAYGLIRTVARQRRCNPSPSSAVVWDA